MLVFARRLPLRRFLRMREPRCGVIAIDGKPTPKGGAKLLPMPMVLRKCRGASARGAVVFFVIGMTDHVRSRNVSCVLACAFAALREGVIARSGAFSVIEAASCRRTRLCAARMGQSSHACHA
jgi:hypothetical protein